MSVKAGLRLSLGLAMALVLTGAGAAPAQVEHYAVREGLNVNSFTRAGPAIGQATPPARRLSGGQ